MLLLVRAEDIHWEKLLDIRECISLVRVLTCFFVEFCPSQKTCDPHSFQQCHSLLLSNAVSMRWPSHEKQYVLMLMWDHGQCYPDFQL